MYVLVKMLKCLNIVDGKAKVLILIECLDVHAFSSEFFDILKYIFKQWFHMYWGAELDF
jgi:hypothetical protein